MTVASMTTTTLLSLPTEILDKIYSCLDWDRSKSLRPDRPDIISISLTCQHLRQTIQPLVFQNVTLKLRWVDGALVEPALFGLRKAHPHLANYVRSVYIETHFRQSPPYGKLTDFAVPDELSDWVQPSSSFEDRDRDMEVSHRQRVNSVARTLVEVYHRSELLTQCPPHLRHYLNKLVRKILDDDDLTTAHTMQKHLLSSPNRTLEARRIGEAAYFDRRHEIADALDSATATRTRRRWYRSRRLELDALVLVVLCLPACVNSLAFETIHNHRDETLQNNFALHVAAMALGIFGDRLKRLTMITSPERKPHHRAVEDPEQQAENSIITDHVLGEIKQVGTLVLSDYHGDGNPRYREISTHWQVQWHVLARTVTHLELWNIQSMSAELVQLITGFTGLRSLAMENIMLRHSTPQLHHPPQTQTDQLFWLAFLIELRRQMPDLNLQLGELKSWGEQLRMVILPKSALQWFQIEAVPAGGVVGFDRETRLTEDFESFLPLWYAEDSERGKQAKEERKDGRLVDAAMRTFERFS